MSALQVFEPRAFVNAIALACGVFLAIPSTYAQPAITAAEVLQRVKATYTNMSQYRLSTTITEQHADASGNHSKTTAFISVAVHKPNQLRWEVTGDGAAAYTGMYVGEVLIVSDGQSVFSYQPKLKQFTKQPLGPFARPNGTVPAFIQHIEDKLFYGYRFMGPDRAAVLKDETISANGSLVDCYVIQIATQFQTVFTWWIDKSKSVVLRETFQFAGQHPSLKRRTEVSVIQIGGPVDDSLFVFSAPIGAQQVAIK